MDELQSALELDRRVALRAAERTIEIPAGWVVLHDQLARVHVLNMLILAAPLPSRLDAATLTSLAESWLGHLGHRFVRIDDEAGAARLTSKLLAAGWQRQRTVFMVLRTDPGAALVDPRARQVSEAELDALMLANFEHYDYGADACAELVRELVAAQVAMRRGTQALRFGAGERGGLQSMTTLFMDPDVDGTRVAMVEQVGTLPDYRERGLAQAAVSAAVAAAGKWGAELITVPADADDWPQMLYTKLGFEPIGIQVSFTLRAPARAGAT
ncbi:MAG: GNAT family N-acetyltransferase [Solirubrobacteraceae bacterium]